MGVRSLCGRTFNFGSDCMSAALLQDFLPRLRMFVCARFDSGALWCGAKYTMQILHNSFVGKRVGAPLTCPH